MNLKLMNDLVETCTLNAPLNMECNHICMEAVMMHVVSCVRVYYVYICWWTECSMCLYVEVLEDEYVEHG